MAFKFWAYHITFTIFISINILFLLYIFANLQQIELIKSSIKYTNTIPAPVGIFKKNDAKIPIKKHIIDVKADIITNPLKLVVNFFAIIAGKIIKLEINIVPIILIPTTTTKAVKSAIKNW